MTFWDRMRWIDARKPHARRGTQPAPRRNAGGRASIVSGALVAMLLAYFVPTAAAGAASPSMSVNPTQGLPGQAVSVSGASFSGRSTVQLLWDGTASGMPIVRADARGTFAATIIVPQDLTGPHAISASTSSSKHGSTTLKLGAQTILARTSFQVTSSAVDPTPTDGPTPVPTSSPTEAPGAISTPAPTTLPSSAPTASPTFGPVITPAPPPPSPSPNPTQAPTPTASPTAAPTATPFLPTYTFRDEFDLVSPLWLRHFHCCGTLAGFDASLSSVNNGVLAMRVDQRVDGWYGDLIDTKTTWTQKYGYFEARIKIPKGPGLWPAFWTYYDSGSVEAEIDGMEVCANPLSANGGNDASLLHNYIHWQNGGSMGDTTRTADLSLDYHVYAFDWRADHVSFYLDGTEVWRMTDTAHIPSVALPIILNLGVGGSWCGSPSADTPDGSTMLVDWVRVRP